MKIQPKYIQLIGDAVIPLLGFFLWNWSLYFIVLFYFIDLILAEVIIHLKTRKTIYFRAAESKSLWIKQGVLSMMIFTVNCVLIHLALFILQPTIDFQHEAMAFWSYKEIGIEQGYILLPLLIFVAYQKYKMEFLLPTLYKTIDLNLLWKSHNTTNLILLAFVGLALGLFSFVAVPDWMLILIIVALSAAYKLIPKPR